MDELGPWIDKNFIRNASVDAAGKIVLLFTDGVEEAFDIEGCSKGQVGEILSDLRKKGIAVR